MRLDFSCVHSSQSLLKLMILFMEHIPWINESHDLGRPFKVVIRICPSSAFSLIASSCSLIWETLVKYDYMVFQFYIFIFLSWFLNVIFWLMLFPSNIVVKESNTSFSVLKDDTWGMRWSLIESAMILLALTNFFLWVTLASSPSSSGTSPLI